MKKYIQGDNTQKLFDKYNKSKMKETTYFNYINILVAYYTMIHKFMYEKKAYFSYNF